MERLVCCLVRLESGDVLDGAGRDHFSKMETLLLGPGLPGPANNTRIVKCSLATGLSLTYLDG